MSEILRFLKWDKIFECTLFAGTHTSLLPYVPCSQQMAASTASWLVWGNLWRLSPPSIDQSERLSRHVQASHILGPALLGTLVGTDDPRCWVCFLFFGHSQRVAVLSSPVQTTQGSLFGPGLDVHCVESCVCGGCYMHVKTKSERHIEKWCSWWLLTLSDLLITTKLRLFWHFIRFITQAYGQI